MLRKIELTSSLYIDHLFQVATATINWLFQFLQLEHISHNNPDHVFERRKKTSNNYFGVISHFGFNLVLGEITLTFLKFYQNNIVF